jgi:hypothetical protein
VAGTLLLGACSDRPTLTQPEAAAPPEAVLSSQGAKPLVTGQGASPYACFTSVATPQGPYKYRYGRVNLEFPKEALAPDGRTVRYRIRRYEKDGSIKSLANCVIPATHMAVQAMNRRFGMQGKAMSRRKSGASDGGTIGIQACVDVTWRDGEVTEYCSDDPPPDDDDHPPSDDDDYYCKDNPDSPVCGGDPPGAGGGNDPCTGCEPDEPPAEAPEGVDQDWYNTLNKAEKLLCVRYASRCPTVGYYARSAGEWARQQTPQLGTAEGDNLRDAYRHTLWQAYIANHFGDQYAMRWGDAHERTSGNSCSTGMDQSNNTLGRWIGLNYSPSQFESEIFRAEADKRLITSREMAASYGLC